MAPSDALLIVNPAARHGETKTMLPAIERLLEGILPHETVLTAGPGDARELAAAAAGRSLVVAVGGDGTVHEVLNGIMRIPEPARPALGIVPTGSGNDTRRTYGIPSEIPQAVLALAAGERRRFDVGVCNGLYFNNSFAAGLDAKVTAKAVEYKVTTRRDGLWLYLTALLHVLFHDLEGFTARVSFDDGPPQRLETLIIAITIGQTYGGGFRITPDAIPDDGLFDVCTIDPLSLPGALARLPFVVLGKHTRMRPVHMLRCRTVVIEADRPVPAQIDGEVLLEQRYEVSLLPEAVTCIVPRRG